MPLYSLLSKIIPPPTPVPSVNITEYGIPFDDPITCSAQAAALASFSTNTGFLLKLLKSIVGYSLAIFPVEPKIALFELFTAPQVAKAITSTSFSYFEIISSNKAFISLKVLGV